jgi:hypothetical protein
MLHQIKNLTPIGQVAVFYLPVVKLDEVSYGRGGKTPRDMIHEFLIEHYDAYTLEISNTQGFWRQHKQSKLFVDENARYEVSFAGKDRIPSFVAFLSRMCVLMDEEAIYLTMGRHSYLVEPEGAE